MEKRAQGYETEHLDDLAVNIVEQLVHPLC